MGADAVAAFSRRTAGSAGGAGTCGAAPGTGGGGAGMLVRVRSVRIVWSLLALGAGAAAVVVLYLLSLPADQFTACEIHVYTPGCEQSLLDRGGVGVAVAVLLPVVLCAVPVALPRRVVVWGVVLALLGAGVLLRAVVGPVGLVPLLGVPPAVALAVGHTRLSRGRCPPTAVLADLFHPR